MDCKTDCESHKQHKDYKIKDIIKLLLQLADNILITKTQRLNKKFLRSYHELNKEANKLTQRQYTILFVIGYCRINTLTEIAKYHAQTNGGLSTVVSKMEASGYIVKVRHIANDGRKIAFELTDKGVVALKQLTTLILNELDDFYKNLDKTQKKYFVKGYEKLASFFKEESSKIQIFAQQNNTKLSIEILKSIIAAINYLGFNVFNEFDCNGKKERLTLNRFRILYQIWHFENNTISKLAAVLGVNQSTMSTAIKNLTNDGYLRKEYLSEQDARKLRLHITEKGRDEVLHILKIFKSKLEASIERLEKDKLALLIQGLTELHISFMKHTTY